MLSRGLKMTFFVRNAGRWQQSRPRQSLPKEAWRKNGAPSACRSTWKGRSSKGLRWGWWTSTSVQVVDKRFLMIPCISPFHQSALLEEQKSVMQHCADERRKLAAEWAHFHTMEKQRHERAEREVSSLLEKREGSIISLAQVSFTMEKKAS